MADDNDSNVNDLDDDSDDGEDEDDSDEDREDEDDEDDSDDDKRERVRIKIERDRERVRMREEIKIEFVADDGSIVKIERKVEIKDGKVKVKIKRKVTYLNGTVVETTIVIERERDKIKKKLKIEGVDGLEVETELEIEDEFEGNETDLAVVMSNGRRALIKIMPDAASEIALERLRALNFTGIELKEIRHKNVPRVVYNIETNKEGRFFGIFKLKLKIEGQVDPETGEFIGISKPWWAFLVVGEETDETGEEMEEELRIKAETLNGSSEVKVELEFDTESTETDTIVLEILEKINLSAEEVDTILEMETSIEPLEQKDELDVRVDIKDGIAEVEFELEFFADTDLREEITSFIVTELSGLTAEDLNSAVGLNTTT